MALTDEGMGTTMLMQPAYGVPYGNGGYGGLGLGGDGYSRAESDFRDRLEDAIDSAPDEHKRKKLERILNEM